MQPNTIGIPKKYCWLHDFCLHADDLPNQQVAIPQRATPFANRRRGPVALRQKITAQAVANLLRGNAIIFFFAAAMARSIAGCVPSALRHRWIKTLPGPWRWKPQREGASNRAAAIAPSLVTTDYVCAFLARVRSALQPSATACSSLQSVTNPEAKNENS